VRSIASLTDIGQAKMGLAVLIDQENCLNFLGLRCDVCYRVCPVIDKAITLERIHNPRSDRHAMLLPTVHSEYCTGCGKCEKACVLPGESAIKVLPIKLAQGSKAEHYLRGWEEKEAAGRSLIGDQVELPVRGLEDKAYGDTRVKPGEGPQAPEYKPAQLGSGGLDSGWKP
jgi:ferredoxin-type protein NapG